MSNEAGPRSIAEMAAQKAASPASRPEARGRFFNTGNAFDIRLPAVPDRIGRVLLTLGQVPDKSVLAGKFDIIWADYFYKPGWAKIPGVYAMKYMTAVRDPNPNARIPNSTGDEGLVKSRDLNWYHRNHPDWVVYKCPGAPEPPMCRKAEPTSGPTNPAYACFYPYSVDYVPLDVTNPAVRQFLFDSNLGGAPYVPRVRGYPSRGATVMSYPTVLGSGLYDAVGVDNLNAENGFGACGIYRDGRFRQLYTGSRIDPQYVKQLVGWLNWLRQRVNAAGVCLAGNDYFTTKDWRGFLEIAAALDIVMDEHGFARDKGPIETGAAWRTRVDTLRRVIATGKPVIIVDYVSPPARGARTRAAVSWSIANYLLIKSDRTYLALTSPRAGADPAKAYPELFIKTGRPLEAMQINKGLYWRHFTHALAVVNPSSQRARMNLGGARWHALDGGAISGTVDIPPATALVLTDATSAN